MPSAPSVASIRTEVVDLMSDTTTGAYTNARVNQLIARKLSETYNLLVGISEDYFITSATITLSANANSINTSTTTVIATSVAMLKLKKIFYTDGKLMYELQQMNVNDYQHEYYNTTTTDPRDFKWMLLGKKLIFSGKPVSNTSLILWYVPAFNDALTSTSALTWVVPFNWTDMVVYGVCADLRERNEEDPKYFTDKYREAKQVLVDEATNRSLAQDYTFHDAFHRWQ